MAELIMTPAEKIDTTAILNVFKTLNPENQRQLFYMGLGMHYGNTYLSKENQDAKSSAD